MYARSRGVAVPLSASARCTSDTARASSAGSIGALMFGPSTSAWPQYAIAHAGSRRAASANARPASAWLNPYVRLTPWLMKSCARSIFVETANVWTPRFCRRGANGMPGAAGWLKPSGVS